MQIIKNHLSIGAERPFTILHMTDTHLTCTDERDGEERTKFACARRRMSPSAMQDLEFVKDRLAQLGATLIHTGDLVDFITPENLRVANRFVKETGLWMAAGNHELHHCPNNVFCEEDFTQDLAIREQTLDEMQAYFENDIRFSCHTVNGVNLVGISNADYQISATALSSLKEVVAQGKPIVLFMHIPLFCQELLTIVKDAMLATPDEIVMTYTPFRIFEQQADSITREAYDYITKQDLIKCVISGHLHINFETQAPNEKKQLITGLQTLREIYIS